MSKTYIVPTVCRATLQEYWSVTLSHDRVPTDNELLDAIETGVACPLEQTHSDEQDRAIVGRVTLA